MDKIVVNDSLLFRLVVVSARVSIPNAMIHTSYTKYHIADAIQNI